MIKYYVENRVKGIKTYFENQTQAENYYRHLQANGYTNGALVIGVSFK